MLCTMAVATADSFRDRRADQEAAAAPTLQVEGDRTGVRRVQASAQRRWRGEHGLERDLARVGVAFEERPTEVSAALEQLLARPA